MTTRIVFALGFMVGCTGLNDPSAGDEPVGDLGSADSLGGDCPFEGSDARGVLALVNDSDVDIGVLDVDIGLDSRAASAIFDARPIEDLAELDALSYVGPSACSKLRAAACDVRGLCENELRTITWNVEHFPLTGDTIDEVVDAIEELGPEIIGFQEVDDPDAFDELEARLPGYNGFVGVKKFGTRVAIMYRRDRLRVTEIEDLFPDDSSAFPRPPLAVTFEIDGRSGSASFTFITVHLKAGGDDSDKRRRRDAIDQLDRWMDSHHTDASFLVGDMNDQLDDSLSENVFAPLLGEGSGYSLPTLPILDHSYIPFPRLIDHIVLNEAAEATFPTVGARAVPLDESIIRYRERVSDHRPVETTHIPLIPL